MSSRTSIQYGLTPSTVGKFAEELPPSLPPVGDAMLMRLKAAFPQYKARADGQGLVGNGDIVVAKALNLNRPKS